jgi:formate/nitrite transporter FocA (FNT family)
MSKILYFCIVRIMCNVLIQNFIFLSFNKNKIKDKIIIICPKFYIFVLCESYVTF